MIFNKIFKKIEDTDIKIVKYIQKKTKLYRKILNLLSLTLYAEISVPTCIFLGYCFQIGVLKYFLFFLYIELFNHIIKISFGRKRPYIKNEDIICYDIKKPESKSLPSTHSCFSIIFSLLFYYHVATNYYVFLFPLLIGISRMALGVHYFTDVLMGYILGIFFYLQFKPLI